MEQIQNDFATRAADLTIYLRFVGVLVLMLATIQLYQAFRDAAYLKLIVAGAVTILAALAVTEPQTLLDRL